MRKIVGAGVVVGGTGIAVGLLWLSMPENADARRFVAGMVVGGVIFFLAGMGAVVAALWFWPELDDRINGGRREWDRMRQRARTTEALERYEPDEADEWRAEIEREWT